MLIEYSLFLVSQATWDKELHLYVPGTAVGTAVLEVTQDRFCPHEADELAGETDRINR